MFPRAATERVVEGLTGPSITSAYISKSDFIPG